MSESHLYARLRAVWRREQVLRLAEGALACLRWMVVMFLGLALMDWLASKWVGDIPAPGRVVLLLVVLGVSLYKAWQAGWRSLGLFNPTRTALQIEAHRGGMESLLVTALQLKDEVRRRGTSDALCELTVSKAEETAGGIEPRETIRFLSLRRPAVVALAAVLLFGGLAVTNGPLLIAGLGRIFAPWCAVSYPTRTRLELINADMVVREGSPVLIAARLSGAVPRKAKLHLRTGSGRPRIRKIAVEHDQCAYKIETAYRSFQYRLTAGDARSPWHEVEVIGAPNIVQADVTLEFPAYTQRATETVEALTLTVPETTRVSWTLSLDRAVGEATLTLADQEPVPMAISEDGRTVSIQQEATGSRAYSFSWVDSDHGFAFTSPNHYLQVAPDRAPQVELTVPDRNLYATLGRRVDLAFRGRDDHGIAEATIAYRVDKMEEQRIGFTPAKPVDGTEQTIDWDYRSVLTNLVVGQTVAFAVELADRYPGETGPHRVRSETRSIQFMTREDYLAQIERQTKRLLSQLRHIYKEEREVHETVMRLDRSDPVFIQTCQLEAVRQDMVGERLKKLAVQIGGLSEDLAANLVTNQTMTAALDQLRVDLFVIADEHVSQAATALRTFASESGGKGDSAAHAHAAHMVNSSARELGLLVLDLGFHDAADVMGREMHAAAQTQAALRLRTIVPGAGAADLVEAQERLGRWLSRLFAATPKGKESSAEDALIEFTLTRIVKQQVHGGVAIKLQKAAELIGDGRGVEAAKLQSEVIASLLKAEFRLRVGAEREALAKAMALFLSQQEKQKALRLALKDLHPDAIGKRRSEFVSAQDMLHRNLQLLLMPDVPAPRVRLFDDALPAPPPTNDQLLAADQAMTAALAHLEAGELAAAEKAQLEVEAAFAALAEIARKRIVEMTQAVRIERLTYGAAETVERLAGFSERQLSLLEKSEDAAADDSKSEYLAEQEGALAEAVHELGVEIGERINRAGTVSEESQSLPIRIAEALQAMRHAIPLLKANKPGEAIRHQEAAVAALGDAQAIVSEHGQNISAYAAMLSSTKSATVPSPYVAEIEEEQRDMLELTRTSKPDDMPGLAIPQKNLVHAVNAILVALDPIAHLVESGTVMLFAKEDMDAAGTALAIKDEVEALDAQTFIVETLEELRSKIEAVVPQYRYLLELSEALHETIQEGILVREAQRLLREKSMETGVDVAALVNEQVALKTRTDAYGTLMHRVTGLDDIAAAALAHMAEAERLLGGGDASAAQVAMALAEQSLRSDTLTLLKLMKHLTLVLAAPLPATTLPEEVVFLQEVLRLAARQKDLYRESHTADAGLLKDYGTELGSFETACEPLIERAKGHRNPVVVAEVSKGRKGDPPPVVEPPKELPPANLHLNLVAAKEHLARAAAGARGSERKACLESQREAAENLRYCIVEYALKFLVPPPPPAAGDPAPSDTFNESEDMLSLFMPGAVMGTRPPDGRLEWEVLGKRDRAALNENFARELPLEYRAVLKDYYERLAK